MRFLVGPTGSECYDVMLQVVVCNAKCFCALPDSPNEDLYKSDPIDLSMNSPETAGLTQLLNTHSSGSTAENITSLGDGDGALGNDSEYSVLRGWLSEMKMEN